jgi:hypothetical protein
MVDSMVGYDDYQNQVDSFNESIPSGRGMKFWVFAISNGRYVDIGCKDTESEAYSMAYIECPDKHFEIFPTNTTNIAEAHRRFKKWILQKTHNLDHATSLISRKPAQKQQEKEKPFGEGIF